MIDIRLRTVLPDDELDERMGKILTDDDFSLLVTDDALIRKPQGPTAWCRLTAFTGEETEKMEQLHPLLRFVGDRMRDEVSDRWARQMEEVGRTDPAWVIPGTPFTTVTINNTWPTAVHTDKGDLEEGFSNLAVLRRGSYTGGTFVFPRYRVGFDLHDGDLILMDAHEAHGNTPIVCSNCEQPVASYHECMEPDTGMEPACDFPLNVVERISVVAYFRTKMVACGRPEDEAAKQRVLLDQRAAARMGDA
jgi:hypothetical protein